MLYIENVTGSKEASAPLIMNVDTIYVHTDVRTVEDEEGRVSYVYTERQYTYDEFKEHHVEVAKLLADDAKDEYTLSLMEGGLL